MDEQSEKFIDIESRDQFLESSISLSEESGEKITLELNLLSKIAETEEKQEPATVEIEMKGRKVLIENSVIEEIIKITDLFQGPFLRSHVFTHLSTALMKDEFYKNLKEENELLNKKRAKDPTPKRRTQFIS